MSSYTFLYSQKQRVGSNNFKLKQTNVSIFDVLNLYIVFKTSEIYSLTLLLRNNCK